MATYRNDLGDLVLVEGGVDGEVKSMTTATAM